MMYQVKKVYGHFANKNDYDNIAFPYFEKYTEIVILVNIKGEYSFHLKKLAEQGNFNLPFEDNINNYLNQECLYHQKEVTVVEATPPSHTIEGMQNHQEILPHPKHLLRSSFFEKFMLIENRHLNDDSQRDYDKRFGLNLT
jgi:hypothetical protein